MKTFNTIAVDKTKRPNTSELCNTELNLDHILFFYTLELSSSGSDSSTSSYKQIRVLHNHMNGTK